MAHHINATVECHMVGEFVAEGEVPPELVGTSAEVCPTEIVASYESYDIREAQANEFSVLLRDNRVVTVQGHSLKYLQNPVNPADYGSYAILRTGESGEVVVALFPVSEVIGIFNGRMKTPGQDA
jgi:hypothetical protein